MSGEQGRLTAHGTLYKALGWLTAAGLLDDRREDPDQALAEGRPRRRLYRIKGEGMTALARASVDAASAPAPPQPGVAPA